MFCTCGHHKTEHAFPFSHTGGVESWCGTCDCAEYRVERTPARPSEEVAEPEKPIIHRGCFVCGQALVSDGHIRDCVAKLRIRSNGYRIMARKMLDQCLWEPMMEEGKYARAGGDVECSTCRLLYLEHPELPKYPTFHMLCSGKIVKT